MIQIEKKWIAAWDYQCEPIYGKPRTRPVAHCTFHFFISFHPFPFFLSGCSYGGAARVNQRAGDPAEPGVHCRHRTVRSHGGNPADAAVLWQVRQGEEGGDQPKQRRCAWPAPARWALAGRLRNLQETGRGAGLHPGLRRRHLGRAHPPRLVRHHQVINPSLPY